MNTRAILSQSIYRKAPSMQDIWLPTGITLFNLALSGHRSRGFRAGSMGNLIGDSWSGKSLAAINFLATVANSEHLSKYKLFYDDVEASLSFNTADVFGKIAASRILPPSEKTGENDQGHSDSLADFETRILRLMAKYKKNGIIYVLDSFDALMSSDDEAAIKSSLGGSKKKGSYGAEKAKYASAMFRRLKRRIRDTNSFLLVISQTRDVMNALPFQSKVSRSGGRALKFYSSYEMWLANTGTETNKVTGAVISRRCGVKITKNRTNNGWSGRIAFPIVSGYGVDDIGANIDFLINSGYWRKTSGGIICKEVSADPLKRRKLITRIEEGKQGLLSRIVQLVWTKANATPSRKAKYE